MSKRPKKAENVGHFLFNINHTEYEILRLLMNEYTQEGTYAKRLKMHFDDKAREKGSKSISLVYLWECIHNLETIGLVEIDDYLQYAKRIQIPEKVKESLINALTYLRQLENTVKEVKERQAREMILTSKYHATDELVARQQITHQH